MDRQRRSRYVLAVYLVVLSLAILLVLAGLFFTTNPDWKAVWINLGTSLLGVVVLFFLVQRFFLADEWGLSDRIEQLVRRLELSERPSKRQVLPHATGWLAVRRDCPILCPIIARFHPGESSSI